MNYFIKGVIICQIKLYQKNTSANNVDLINASARELGLTGTLGLVNPENYVQIGQTILETDSIRNMMIPAILNRIGLVKVKYNTWTNPLAETKKGLLGFGETVEQIHINLCEEHVYNPDSAEHKIYKRELPDVNVIFHKLNRKGFFKQTIERDNLRQAFLSMNGIDQLSNGIMGTMTTSDEVAEYKYMKNLISNYVRKKFTYDVQSNEVINSESADSLLVQLRTYARLLGFVSRKYNQFGVDNNTPINEIFLYITPQVEANLDVRSFAMAFNLEYKNFIGHVIVVDDFGDFDDGNTQCIMAGEDFLQCYDDEISVESKYNEEGKYWQQWLHHWEVLSVSRFANVIRFTKGTPNALVQPKVNNITLDKTELTIEKGADAKITATVDAINDAGTSVFFNLFGATSAHTIIDDNGFIRVGADETGKTITVKCFSAFDNNISASANITVVTPTP